MEEKNLRFSYSQQLDNEIFHRVIYSLATETILFIKNDLNFDFASLLMTMEVEGYELWRLIDDFLGYDPMMPIPLK